MLVLLASCVSAGDAAQPIPEGAPRLRIMTYNVSFEREGDPEGVAAVASASPDIVVLQETNAAWERAFRALPFAYRHFQAPEAKRPAGGMGVLSKFPIRSIEHCHSAAAPGIALRIVIDAPGGPLQILVVHLHTSRDPHSKSSVEGYFTTRPIRAREATDHVARLARDLPTIVAGDFNEEDEGRAVAIVRERGFASALPQFQPDADTWQRRVWRVMLQFRFDHILYDARAFRAVGAAVVEAGRSDHAPVWADLVRLR